MKFVLFLALSLMSYQNASAEVVRCNIQSNSSVGFNQSVDKNGSLAIDLDAVTATANYMADGKQLELSLLSTKVISTQKFEREKCKVIKNEISRNEDGFLKSFLFVFDCSTNEKSNLVTLMNIFSAQRGYYEEYSLPGRTSSFRLKECQAL